MSAAQTNEHAAQKLGIAPDMVVQEFGWDEDVDEQIRTDIQDALGADLLDEDAGEVVDVVLLWWREGDGDLVDALVDAIELLAEDGFIWVLSPKTGHPGYIEQSEISEAAPTAGLATTKVIGLGDWSGTRIVQLKAKGHKK
ncbi:conserved hypothetical protein [Segniliparus rotundus DSM 44985]|uniref:DUF3052 domain-containing protein n=1 Tax=Segniliparus rotundus (strain ATCC BAA-972 / CDC 1076 / CIP 108378 / DSM 44985 / JCM 13578) TaxID=640132 RepID=D6ZCY0_SEGRD|nr:DUF3052 domain-containing protein [Segniliparus rotundus]ADG99167.1 conserved hypothetical protein [Segniliparus rotundus DSM 44985]